MYELILTQNSNKPCMYVHLEIYSLKEKLIHEAHEWPFYTVYTYTCPPNNSYEMLQAKAP